MRSRADEQAMPSGNVGENERTSSKGSARRQYVFEMSSRSRTMRGEAAREVIDATSVSMCVRPASTCDSTAAGDDSDDMPKSGERRGRRARRGKKASERGERDERSSWTVTVKRRRGAEAADMGACPRTARSSIS